MRPDSNGEIVSMDGDAPVFSPQLIFVTLTKLSGSCFSVRVIGVPLIQLQSSVRPVPGIVTADRQCGRGWCPGIFRK